MTDARLELLAEKHLPSVAAMFDDEGVRRYTRVPDPAPPGWEHEWLEFYEEGRREGKREAFAVVDGDDGSFLGLALAFGIDREGRQLELGYVVAPEARGRGVATQALELLTDFDFERRVEAGRCERWLSPRGDAALVPFQAGKARRLRDLVPAGF